jgi:hypothetical protein
MYIGDSWQKEGSWQQKNHLVVTIRVARFPRFGILRQEKSGSPGDSQPC